MREIRVEAKEMRVDGAWDRDSPGIATAKALHGWVQNPENAMTRFRHILVPVDFEESSREALDVAIDLAHTFDARLTLVHTWEVPAYGYAGMSFAPIDLLTPIEQAAKGQLESTLAAVRKRVPRAESVLATGSAADEVLAAADRVKPDLIVMGTHGRHGLRRVFLGSVAEKVVRGSPVPVLTIRAKGREPV
jgi:nucleotide-binding universal stress UspA family protein